MASGVFGGDLIVYAPGRGILAAARRPGLSFGDPLGFTAGLRFSGAFRVFGTVAVSGSPDIPVSRKVRLYHVKTGCNCAAETWSAADGTYVFEGINRGPWTVISYDHTGEFNAVVADNIIPEPM